MGSDGWELDPSVLLPLAVYAAVYGRRFVVARREAGGRGAGSGRLVAFAGAVLVMLVALASPVDRLGRDLFSMHMTQHVLLGDIAPVLFLLALSRVILRPATRRLMALERALGRLAHPGTALVAWFTLIYVWHVPALYQAAIEDPLLHGLEHVSFFTAGLAVWWPLVQPVPMRRRLTGMWPFAYLGVAKLGLGLLGLYLVWSKGVVYAYYETVPRLWGLSALEDQSVGGAIMMVEQSTVLALAFVVLFVRMLSASEEEDRRRERLDDAAAA